MGIKGAALATGIGQVLTLVIYIIAYLRCELPVKLSAKHKRPDGIIIAKMYSIGIPATLNLALPSLLISALNGILAAYSQSYVLVLGIYYKLQTFLYLTANGVIQGMRPVISFNYGAGEKERVKKIYSIVLYMTGVILAAGTIICALFPAKLIGLFTENADTIAIGKTALRLICIGFVISAVSVTSSGALEGLGMGIPSLMISLCRFIAIILPLAFFLCKLTGPTGVWNAFWITEVVTALISVFIYRFSVSRLVICKKALTFCKKSVIIYLACRCGGIGRHKGLKIPRGKTRTGSSPVSGTRIKALRSSCDLRAFLGYLSTNFFGIKINF